MPGTSPSVLIIRLDAIGDALALTPLLAALHRRAIPTDVVLRAANSGIFSSRAVRRTIVAPFDLRSGTAANLAAIDELGAALEHRRYTHVLVATEDPSGYRLARATRAPARVGFSNGWGKPLKALWARRHLTSTLYRSAGLDRARPHECEVLFRLGGELVSESEPTRELARLRPLVLEAASAPDPRIVVQITDRWERLGIPVADVAEALRQAHTLGTIRALAARSEEGYGRVVAFEAGIEIEYFDGLEPWKAAIAGARAVVAPDSGAAHVAGMTGTPVVAVFPPGREFWLLTARWAPWAAPHRIVAGAAGWPQRARDALAELLPAATGTP